MPIAEVLTFLSLAKPVVDLLGNAVLEKFNTPKDALTTEAVVALIDRVAQLRTLKLDDFVGKTLKLKDIDLDLKDLPAALTKIEAAIKSDLPAVIQEIGAAVEAAGKLFDLPTGENILKDLADKFRSHNESPTGRAARGKLDKGADGLLIGLLIDKLSKKFRYWADENSLPEVTDDREMVPSSASDTGEKKNKSIGKKSVKIARIAYQEAWMEWLDRIDVEAVDSFDVLLSNLPLVPPATERDPKALDPNDIAAEKAMANVIVKTVTHLPSNYRALTTLGGAGIANRGLEMELNGTLEWKYSEFKGTVAHEIGHLLGLDDVDDPSLLMSGVYSNVNEPREGDVEAAKANGWKLV